MDLFGTHGVQPASPQPEWLQIAAALPPNIRLGTSSWNFPGWAGLVWDREYAESRLSREGLAAYAAHPLLRTVSLDRALYRPLSASDYARYADQTPDNFRLMVKAPALVTDAMVRADDGRGMQPNPAFLDAATAWSACAQPLIDGLGARLGVLVLQLSPVGARWLRERQALMRQLGQLLAALQPLREQIAGAIIAVEVRNPELLAPDFADVLREHGAVYCLGLHAKMPPIDAQLPMLRALWPGPLVCRWSLHGKHGRYGYEQAKALYEPFNAIVDPDPSTRTTLVKVMRATAQAGFDVYVTVNNKAEGSAPLSVLEIARECVA
jgi:uncharacterized protein YecE (DUF72 family)